GGRDWNGRAIRGKTGAVRRLFNAEHVLYRTAESDDPARLRLFLSEDDMSRPLEATSGRASGITPVRLQLCRPHRALKFGREIRTAAMRAGLTGKRLTLRKIFCFGIVFLASSGIVLAFVYPATSFSIENDVPRMA